GSSSGPRHTAGCRCSNGPALAGIAGQETAEELRTSASAGSRNSDQVLSGNSGHPDLSRSGSRLVAPSDEGKDDRLAQAPRNPGSAAGGTQPAGGSKAGRSRRPKRSARRG